MNRGIKFRAWDEINNQMIYPKIYESSFSILSSGDLLNRYETIMQFTGLHDKNGKEIYEGDILSFIDFDFNSDDEFLNYGLVEYYVSEMRFFITNRNSVEMDEIDFEKEVEIIGNIYENPELLNRRP